MKILRVKKLPIYDVFYGDGWLNWTRVIKHHDNLKVLGGNQLIDTEKFAIKSYIKRMENNV